VTTKLTNYLRLCNDLVSDILCLSQRLDKLKYIGQWQGAHWHGNYAYNIQNRYASPRSLSQARPGNLPRPRMDERCPL